MTLPPASRRSAALVAIGAALLVASYPPFRLPLLSFVAVAPAVVLLHRLEQECHPRDALRWGFAYGFVTQGAVLYWLVVALWHFTPLSALGYLATIAIFGLWHGLLFWLVLRVRRRLPAVPLALVFPLAWTAVEWAVGHQGDIRFPWLGLGTSLGDAPVLVQWADLAGARGVTLWLAWCNVMIVDAVGRGSIRWRPVIAVVATVVAAWAYGAWRARTLPLRELGTVGLVQPNEGFHEKWDPAHADSVVAKLLSLSRQLESGGRLDLLVWPEAAVPGWLAETPTWDAQIAALARERHRREAPAHPQHEPEQQAVPQPEDGDGGEVAEGRQRREVPQRDHQPIQDRALRHKPVGESPAQRVARMTLLLQPAQQDDRRRDGDEAQQGKSKGRVAGDKEGGADRDQRHGPPARRGKSHSSTSRPSSADR